MKRVFFLLSALFLSAAVSAQINKGSVLLGGSLSAGTQTFENNSTSKSNGFSFSPSIGVLVRNNLAVGINVGFGRGISKDTINNTETNNFSAGAYVRRYIPLGKSFYLTGDASLNYGKNKQEYTSNLYQPYGYEQTSISLNLYPGIAYAVGKNFHLEASLNGIANLGFSKTNITNISGGVRSTSTSKGFNFSSNASNSIPLNIGFRFLLGR